MTTNNQQNAHPIASLFIAACIMVGILFSCSLCSSPHKFASDEEALKFIVDCEKRGFTYKDALKWRKRERGY